MRRIKLLTPKVLHLCKKPNHSNQMNIKTLLLSSVVGITSIFGGVSEAQAMTCFNVPNVNARICNSYEGSNGYGDVYRLGFASNTGAKTGMTVTCRGSHVVDWKSNGNMNYSYLNTVANYFCNI